VARSAIHPGEHLADAIAAIGITATQLARDLRVPPNRITAILQGQRGITADTGLRLARYFSTSAAFWMNLQQLYDLRVAEAEIGEVLEKISTTGYHGIGAYWPAIDLIRLWRPSPESLLPGGADGAP
jgi:addiction module HigA family antidote